MVMHARKLPRLNDGYFDRNQSHPYQNTGKYSNKSSYNDRYGDKVRDSPSNGSAYRNESPDSQHSPRDRSYHNKSSYSQRLKDRERDRDRHDRDTSRSPKERSGSKSNRDHHQSSSSSSSHRSTDNTEHRSNHDRNSTEDKEKEKRLQVGDWSEHLSSSGKKYYYNCKTEVSQWEKPKEWVEWERQPASQQQSQPQNQLQAKSSGSETSKVKDRNYEKVPSNTSSNSRASEKHSSERSAVRSSSSTHHHHHSRSHDDRHHFKSSTSGGGGGGGSSSSSGSSSRNYAANEQQGYRSGQPQSSQHRSENHARTSTAAERNEHRDSVSTTVEESNRRDSTDRRLDTRKNSEDSQMQDMDISPDSTPTGNSSQPNSQPQSRTQTPISSQQTAAAQQSHTTTQSMSLANLPKLLSQLASNKGIPSLDKTEISPREALQTLQTALFLTRQVSLAQTNMTNHPPHSSISHIDTSFLSQKSPLPVPMPSHATMPAVVVVSSASDAKMRAEDDRGRTSPGGSEYSHRSSRRGSPTSSVSSLHSITAAGTSSLASAALRPAAPLLTPSLANYFREDLIKHVTGWQADHAERQAHRYSEDAHSIGGLNSTKVSADLKTARSFVRVAEIQATLQEQRILFLRQQIKELEDWKSQNSFMSDS